MGCGCESMAAARQVTGSSSRSAQGGSVGLTLDEQMQITPAEKPRQIKRVAVRACHTMDARLRVVGDMGFFAANQRSQVVHRRLDKDAHKVVFFQQLAVASINCAACLHSDEASARSQQIKRIAQEAGRQFQVAGDDGVYGVGLAVGLALGSQVAAQFLQDWSAVTTKVEQSQLR